MESHRSSWNLIEAHGISWKLIESHGSSWNLMEAHGISWKLMETHRSSWKLTEAHGGLLKHRRKRINREVRTSSEEQAWVSLRTDRQHYSHQPAFIIYYFAQHYSYISIFLCYATLRYAISPLYCNPSYCPPAPKLLHYPVIELTLLILNL